MKYNKNHHVSIGETPVIYNAPTFASPEFWYFDSETIDYVKGESICLQKKAVRILCSTYVCIIKLNYKR